MVYESNVALQHHGVKGMKWGVRRYQDYNGKLTSAGKERKKDRYNAYELPEGSTMFRAVSNKSKNFMNRDYTYVNITPHYRKHSINTSEGFDGRFDADYKMKTTKPLKIASVNDYFNAAMKANGVDPNLYLDKIPKNVIHKGLYAVNRLFDHKMREGERTGIEITGIGPSDFFINTINYLKKQGYNGVIDPIDGAHEQKRGEKAIAAIIFDPKETMVIVEEYDR